MTHSTRPRIWSFMLLILVSPTALAAPTLELNYVSPETKRDLELAFEAAKTPFTNLEEKWVCELVGVRTGMQHEKNLPLYAFHKTSSQELTNAGDAPVKRFELNGERTELSGVAGKFRDQVRRLSSTQLISKISHMESQKVLAYARCKKG